MDMKDVTSYVRAELREKPDSRFSEIYFRTVMAGANRVDVHNALTEMLERDEVRIRDGKWRLIAPIERRKSA